MQMLYYRNKIDIIDIPNKMILKKVVYSAFKSGKMKLNTTICSSICKKNHYLREYIDVFVI